MDKLNIAEIRKWVRSELELSADFWLKYGMDAVHGGVYTCLDRKGKVYSTDKSVWMQGRCGWTFAYMCHKYGINDKWLAASKSAIDFLEKYCVNRKAGNRLYFTVTEDGKPLRQRRYCFSEGFYIMANAEYYGVTGDKECIERARKTYDLVYKLNNGLIADPTGLGAKTVPETRQGRALADPMIFLNITSIMRRCDPENIALYDKRAVECVEDIVKYHYKPELKCTLETVKPDGTPMLDVSSGRVVNPGHDIECSWFLMEEANYSHDKELHDTAEKIFNNAYESGWDKEFGGLLSFIDCLGNPPEAYEHDMKLWWPHNETLIASIMLYRDTGNEKYLSIFDTVMDYCKNHFCDDDYGEWYGYLRRDGRPTEPPCKGSTFKGPFHVPRSMMFVDSVLDYLE